MVAHYFETVENTVTGKPVANSSVAVLTAPSASGGTELTIYSDEGLTTPVDNPLTTDSTGYFEFYTDQDECCLEVSYGGTTRRVIENVQLIGASVSTDLTALQVRMDAAEVITQDPAIVAIAGAQYSADIKPMEVMVIALSDDTTAITTGDGKVSWFYGYDFTITEIYIGLGGAVSSSGAVTVDVNKNGSTILSTKPSIDSGERTSLTGTAAVISTATSSKGDYFTADIDAAGADAKGLKLVVIGHRT